jgi:uroporphyrinogen-III decarboxylase
MNSRQRVQAVLDGRLPDRVPVCLHNFLPAAREAGITMQQYRTDPEAVVRAHLSAYEKYGRSISR